MLLHVCIDLRERLWKHILIIVEQALKWHQDITILIGRTKVVDVKNISRNSAKIHSAIFEIYPTFWFICK